MPPEATIFILKKLRGSMPLDPPSAASRLHRSHSPVPPPPQCIQASYAYVIVVYLGLVRVYEINLNQLLKFKRH